MKTRLLLGDVQVKDIYHLLVENPTTVHPAASLRDVLRKMTEDLGTRQVYVTDDDGCLLGAVRMNSVVEYLFPYDAILEHGKSLYVAYVPKIVVLTAADLMKSPPAWVTAETTLEDMARILMEEGINELPVVDSERHLVGQVNIYEVIKAYLDIEQRGSVD